MAQASCLTNTQLLQILNGSLTMKEAAHAEDHLDQCAECLSLLVDLVKVVPAHQTDEFKPVLDE